MEALIRFGIFIAVFAVIAILEVWLPRRALREDRWRRWGVNLGLVAIDVILQRLTLGAAAGTAACYAEQHHWGLLALVAWPWWRRAVAGFLFLDLALYLQHVMSHALPVFWRLHRVHHADLDLDVTSGLRFHPIEIGVSLLYKVLLVAAVGIDPWVVVAFEAVLNASALFTHGNIRLPARLDRALRLVLVTPDMHRIHHSVVVEETNSNFGFFLSVWDRLCGTARRDPAAGHVAMTLGLPAHRDQRRLGLPSLLAMPFRADPVASTATPTAAAAMAAPMPAAAAAPRPNPRRAPGSAPRSRPSGSAGPCAPPAAPRAARSARR